MTDGGATTTDKSTDLYLSGSGYFAVTTDPKSTTPTYLTRVGNLHLNENGYLMDSNGNYVMGTTTKTAATTTAAATFNDPTPIQLESTGLCATYSTTASDGTVSYFSKPMSSTAYSDLRDITFNSDGSISATLDDHNVTFTTTTGDGTDVGNGFSKVVSLATGAKPNDLQIALASVVNEDGLTQAGNNYYTTSASSGPASIGVPKTGNDTKVESGALESSNVDISSEFTTMIKTQRGFQACSRVITTSDSMLEELINLKRS
jgi:flagellar hook protein FlgE